MNSTVKNKCAHNSGQVTLNLVTLPMCSANARGILISSNPVAKITHQWYQEAEEIAALGQAPVSSYDNDNDNDNDNKTNVTLPSI